MQKVSSTLFMLFLGMLQLISSASQPCRVNKHSLVMWGCLYFLQLPLVILAFPCLAKDSFFLLAGRLLWYTAHLSFCLSLCSQKADYELPVKCVWIQSSAEMKSGGTKLPASYVCLSSSHNSKCCYISVSCRMLSVVHRSAADKSVQHFHTTMHRWAWSLPDHGCYHLTISLQPR